MTRDVAAGFMGGMDDRDTWDPTAWDLDDDETFDPSAWDLAMAIRLGVDLDADRAALDELADAMLVWADDEADRLTPAAVSLLWNEELEADIRTGLERVAALGEDWERAAAEALAELERDSRQAAITAAVVQDLAVQLSQADHPPFFCTCCIEEGLSRAPADGRRERALEMAIVARRNAAVPRSELAAALANAPNDRPADRLGTRERRAAVRARLGRIGALASASMPALAAELRAIGEEPLPRAADDDVWAVVCEALLADVARPELN
jgi:hypothetical protein